MRATREASEASCDYEVVETFGDASLIQVSLVTGKRNQIRLQARLRGHTLVGEQRYVYGPQDIRNIDFPRQALHAWRLGIVHPGDRQAHAVRGASSRGYGRAGMGAQRGKFSVAGLTFGDPPKRRSGLRWKGSF